MKHVIDVVVHPEEPETDKRTSWTRSDKRCRGSERSFYRLLIETLCLFEASSIVAMWLRYSVMAVRDKHSPSRNTRSCTSPTLSLKISTTAMAAYGLGPCRSDNDGEEF